MTYIPITDEMARSGHVFFNPETNLESPMITEINSKLFDIAAKHGVQIIHAVESGSRLWGMESQDSDYDVRFIYKRPLSWYLSIGDRRDVIEWMSEDREIDIVGWDIKKALQLLYKSNPSLVEWLEADIIYGNSCGDVDALRVIMRKFFNSRAAIYHYLHMADGNFRRYLSSDIVKMKKYLYVIRPLAVCEFIKDTNSVPSTKIVDNIKYVSDKWPEYVVEFANNLLSKKLVGLELGECAKDETMNAFIVKKIDELRELGRFANVPELCQDDLDALFFKYVMG